MNLHLVSILKQRLSAENLVHIDIRFENVGDKRVLLVKWPPRNCQSFTETETPSSFSFAPEQPRRN